MALTSVNDMWYTCAIVRRVYQPGIRHPSFCTLLSLFLPSPQSINSTQRQQHRRYLCHFFTMPTQSLRATLLVLGKREELPWTSPTWEALSKISGPPWAKSENEADTAPAANINGWTNRLADKVKTFAEKVWVLKSADEQNAFVNRKAVDNESDGRAAWVKFCKDNQTRWGINKIIDDILYDHGRSPQQLLRDLGVRSVSRYIDIHNMNF